jgi:hypothetical protein
MENAKKKVDNIFREPFSELTYLLEVIAKLRSNEIVSQEIDEIIQCNQEDHNPFINLLSLAAYGSLNTLSEAQRGCFNKALDHFRSINNSSVEDIRYKNSVALIARDDSPGICHSKIFSSDENNIAGPNNPSQYEELIEEVIHSFLLDISDPGFKRRCGILLTELLTNTFRHARYDFDGSGIKNSIRGLYLRKYENISPPFVVSVGGLEQPKSNYFEISVFDLGPGFAQRWSSKPLSTMSMQEEYDYVHQCFRKHNTSSGHLRSGRGLSRILRLLSDSESTLYLRTGRLSQFRDSGAMPLGDTAFLRDSKSLSPEPSEQKLSAGSVVSILVPV